MYYSITFNNILHNRPKNRQNIIRPNNYQKNTKWALRTSFFFGKLLVIYINHEAHVKNHQAHQGRSQYLPRGDGQSTQHEFEWLRKNWTRGGWFNNYKAGTNRPDFWVHNHGTHWNGETQHPHDTKKIRPIDRRELNNQTTYRGIRQRSLHWILGAENQWIKKTSRHVEFLILPWPPQRLCKWKRQEKLLKKWNWLGLEKRRLVTQKIFWMSYKVKTIDVFEKQAKRLIKKRTALTILSFAPFTFQSHKIF